MTDESPPIDWSVKRHVAPDGRTILEMHSHYHPADGHEISEMLSPRVIDALSGEAVLDIGSEPVNFAFEWQADGALLLIAAGSPYSGPGPETLQIRIALASGVYAIGEDGWTPRLIAGAQVHIEQLVRADRAAADAAREKALRPSFGDRLLTTVRAAGWIALIGGTLWFIFWFPKP